MAAGIISLTPKVLSDSNIEEFTDNLVLKTYGTSPNTDSDPEPNVLAKEIGPRNTPVIGAGNLIRIVRIEKNADGKVAYPIYSNGSAHLINNTDSLKIGTHQYAIEKYGDTRGRQIAITFDDGPDPTYTPQLLDLLSKEGAPSTFFFIGSNIVKYPDVAKRAAKEGHTIGNHTLTHANINHSSYFRTMQEINLNQKVIKASTGHQTSFFRPPYIGSDDQSFRNALYSIAAAQKLGYVTAGYNFDSDDWEFSQGKIPDYPEFDGSDVVLLVHDGGGNRSQTITYVHTIISKAKQNGYKFVNLNQLHFQNQELFTPAQPTVVDKTAYAAVSAFYVWPKMLVNNLFFTTVGIVIVGTGLNIVLASIRFIRYKPKRRVAGYNPFATVIIPAYNEENVLERTVGSINKSEYKNFEIIIVDDGSKDETHKLAKKMAKKYAYLRACHQQNRGKAAAINRGIREAKGEIIISIDADTLFTPKTINRLVKHFADDQVGGVAGNVKVGNVLNVLTRWQALDYIIGINIERTAQAYLSSILTVPGACGAWRKDALISAGGYSSDTLSEDCDITLEVQKTGYKIELDNSAISYTEAPVNLNSLAKQRFRWTFGNIQSFWKHRDLIFRPKFGSLGFLVIPNAIISILVPLIFMPVLYIVSIGNILQGNYQIILIFLLITFVIQIVVSFIGILLAKEKMAYLIAVPVIRIVYGPLRTYLLYRSAITALRGVSVGWNKLQRTNSVAYMPKAKA